MVEQKQEDTIPAELKEFFFAGKHPPNLNKDYDVIGFDADHCMVKYNIDALTKLIVTQHLEQLKNEFEGYPPEVVDFDLENYAGVILQNACWDIENGTLLKLGQNDEVLHAIRGF